MWGLRKSVAVAAAIAGLAVTCASARAERYRIDNVDKAKRIHMRQTASNRAKVVAYIPPDAIIEGTGRCDDRWCEIAFKGRTGWVFRKYLVPANATAAAPPDKTQRDSAAASVTPPSSSAARDDLLPELQDTMVRLVFNGGRPIPVYAFPSDRLPAAGRITPDLDMVEDLGTCTRKFCYIRAGSLVGWISEEDIIRDGAAPAAVQEMASPPRAKSGEETASILSGPPRALNNTVPTATQAKATPEAPVVVDPKSYTIAGLSGDAALPVREAPEDDAAILALIPGNGTGVEGLRKCLQKWCLVRYESQTGWVARRHLADEASAGERRYQVSGVALWSALDVKEFPGADAGVVGHIPSYATGIVPIGSCDKEWCHVRYLGLAGWVSAKYIAPQAAR